MVFEISGRVYSIIRLRAEIGSTANKEMLAREVALTSCELPRYRNRSLALEEADHRSHHVLRRNRDADVNLVWHQVSFDDRAFFLPRQFVKDVAQVFANIPKHVQFRPTRTGLYPVFVGFWAPNQDAWIHVDHVRLESPCRDVNTNPAGQ